MRHFIDGNLIAFDTETTGLDIWHGDMPFAFSFCNEAGETAYMEWPVDPFTRVVMPFMEELAAIRRLLEDHTIAKVGHNLKFDMRAMRCAFGVETRGELHDTGISTRIGLDRRSFSLKPMCEDVLDYPVDDETALQKEVVRCRRIAKKKGWNVGAAVQCDYWLPKALNPKSRLCQKYAIGDVERTMLLHKYMMSLLQKYDSDRVKEICKQVRRNSGKKPSDREVPLRPFSTVREYEFEMQVFPVTFDMENRGIRVNPDSIKTEIVNTRAHLKGLREYFDRKFGKDFNPGSSQKLAKVLFEVLGLEPYVFTQSGAPSTSKDALAPYVEHPMVQKVLDFRPVSKAEGTYYRAYLHHMVPEMVMLGLKQCKIWTIHCNLNQYGARTSRFSCNDPNLQNIPKQRKGKIVSFLERARGPFCARPGYVNLHMDFSQIEARLFAEEAGDEVMLAAFAAGRDVYEEMADAINRSAFKGKKIVTRDMAKAIFLGILYGEGAGKLRLQLGIKLDVADEIIVAFERTFPKVRQYQRDTIREIKKSGFVITRYGQRLPVPLDEAYKGINYRIQGSAARLLKSSMLRIYNWIEENFPYDMRMLLCIHDELIIEIKEKEFTRKNCRQLQRLMEENDGMWTRVETKCEPSYVTDSWLKKRDLPWLKKAA